MKSRIPLITILISLLYSIGAVVILNNLHDSTVLGWMFVSFWIMVFYMAFLLIMAIGSFLLKFPDSGKAWLTGLAGTVIVYIIVMAIATI